MSLIEVISLPLVAVVYASVLTEPGMLLAAIHYWAEQHLPGWLFMPVIGCFKCVAGQLAMWYYIVTRWHDYHFTEHVTIVSSTIFISILLNYIYEKCN